MMVDGVIPLGEALGRSVYCAEEDSNFHGPFGPQAVNLVTRVADVSRSCAVVQNEHESGCSGRNGRIWMLPRAGESSAVAPDRRREARVLKDEAI
jgi:hypothetical protein